MTTKLPLTITQKGLSALIDAGAGTTNKVRVASIGLTDTPFILAPTLTNLPGEHTRLTTVSGNSVTENVLHMVATDASDATYQVTGIGLYLETGELFGVFTLNGGEDALFEKAAPAVFLFAADIVFQAGEAALIDFGDANFLNPPATETSKGVAYLATDAEVAAGVDGEKIVTPKSLKNVYIPVAQKGVANGVATLDATGKVPPSQLPAVDSIDTFTVDTQAQMLALPAGPGDFALRTDLNKTYVLRAAPATTLGNWAEFLSPGAPVRTVNGKIGDVVITAGDVGAVPTTRVITAAGLAIGGGALDANRTITVNIADAAETLAGIINDKAVTPASLAGLLNALAGKVSATRSIGTAGLATGGGTLDQNRVITVTAASGADVEGLTDNTRAVTALALASTLRNFGQVGYLRIPGSPLILAWGQHTMTYWSDGRGGGTSQFKPFFMAFPSACYATFIQVTSNVDSGDESDETPWISNWQREGFTISNRGDWPTFSFSYFALGV